MSLGGFMEMELLGETIRVLLRFLLKLFRKFLPVTGLSSISTPWLICTSFLISMSAQGRGEISLKVSDLLTLVSKSPPKTRPLPPSPKLAPRMPSTIREISPHTFLGLCPSLRGAFAVVQGSRCPQAALELSSVSDASGPFTPLLHCPHLSLLTRQSWPLFKSHLL